MKTASCRIEVVLLGLGDLLDDAVGALDHLLQLFVLALVQVFLELAALALEVAVLVDQLASGAARARLSASVGASCSSLSEAAFELLPRSLSSFSRLRELGLELGLRGLGRAAPRASMRSVLTKPILKFLRLRAERRQRQRRPAATQQALTATGASSEDGPDLELQALDSIVQAVLRIGWPKLSCSGPTGEIQRQAEAGRGAQLARSVDLLVLAADVAGVDEAEQAQRAVVAGARERLIQLGVDVDAARCRRWRRR